MTKGTFLICGLPRSGTAWVANFLTHGRLHCLHEASAFAASSREPAHEIGRLIQSRAAAFSGSADTAQVFALEALRGCLPGTKIVTIHRPIRNIAQSLRKLNLPVPHRLLEAAEAALKEAARLPETLRVDFAALHSEPTARAIQAHVAPGEPFDRARWEMLRGFNVQITPERWRQLFARAAQSPHPSHVLAHA